MSEDRLKDIEARLMKIEITQAASGATGLDIERRLDKIEDTLTWLVRLIIGAMIMALLAFALGGGFAPLAG